MISDSGAGTITTQALSTKLEEEFISPLTAVRGALEILRDFPQLSTTDQQQFIQNALTECTRLESGIEHLARTVYSDAGENDSLLTDSVSNNKHKQFASRIHLLEDLSIIDLDFSDFEFNSSNLVNEFYDELETVIQHSGKSWYFMVNYTNCSIWPQAWVAFAHRGKKIKIGYSRGTVRYTQKDSNKQSYAVQSKSPTSKSDMFNSRELALAHIKKMQISNN